MSHHNPSETDPTQRPEDAGNGSGGDAAGAAAAHGAIPEPDAAPEPAAVPEPAPTPEPEERVDGDHGPGAEPAGQGKVRMIGIVAASTSMAAAVAGALALAKRDSRRRVLGVPVGTRPRLERNASAVVGGLAALAAPAVALRSRVGRRG